MSGSSTLVVACMGIVALVCGCRTTHDEALRETGLRLSERLEGVEGPVAVAGIYDLSKNRQTKYSATLEEELTQILAGSGVPIVTRRRIVETAQQEHLFQKPWFVDPATSAQAGKMLGAHVLVTGTYNWRTKTIRLLLRALDVETGRVVAASEGDLPENDDVVIQMLGKYPVTPPAR